MNVKENILNALKFFWNIKVSPKFAQIEQSMKGIGEELDRKETIENVDNFKREVNEIKNNIDDELREKAKKSDVEKLLSDSETNLGFRHLGTMETDTTVDSGTYRHFKLSTVYTSNYLVAIIGNSVTERWGLYLIRVNGDDIYAVPIAKAEKGCPTFSNAGNNTLYITANSTAQCHVAVAPLYRKWDEITVTKEI